jgi:hypothetical protein
VSVHKYIKCAKFGQTLFKNLHPEFLSCFQKKWEDSVITDKYTQQFPLHVLAPGLMIARKSVIPALFPNLLLSCRQPRQSSTTCDSTRSTKEMGFDGISIKVHSTRCDVVLNGHQRDCIGGLIKLGALHNTAWREIHFVPKPVKCTVHLAETPFESTGKR